MSKIAYANFLITGPEGYATNAETEQEALELLAGAMDWFASQMEGRTAAWDDVAKKMRTQAKRVRTTNPTTAHWPKRYRFQSSAFEYFDFAAERNRPREAAD